MLITHRLRPPLRAVSVALALLTGFGALRGADARAAADTPQKIIVGYASQTVRAEALGRTRLAGAPAPASDGGRIAVVRVPAGESLHAVLAHLRREPGVAYAQPDFIAHAAGDAATSPSPAATAPQWSALQWNLMPTTGVNAAQAWSNLIADRRPGGRGIVVAVLDTGVAYRDWKNFHRSPDLAGTRFVDPYDFVAGNPYPLDRDGHGTFVTELIAASAASLSAGGGLAYGVSIMPVRVLDASGMGDEITIARGIRYAVNHGAQVINLSLEFLPDQVTSSAEIPAIVDAIVYAHDHGVTIVGAAGNEEADQIAYPARAPGVISVGATTRDRCLADYSNGGLGLDLVAPGGGDDAILPGDPDCHPDRDLPSIRQLTLIDPPHWARFGYPVDYMGTSMATPEVAATAALVISSGVLGPHPTPDQILAQLERTATPLGGSQPNAQYGYGLVNAGAATTAPASTVGSATSPVPVTPVPGIPVPATPGSTTS